MILLPFKDYQSNIKVSVFIYAKISAVKTGGTDLHPDIYSTLYSTSQSMFEEVSEFDISTTSCIRHVDIRVVYLLISSMLNTRYINSRNMEGRYFLYVLDVSMLEILKVV